jgi:hypothetical protein
VWMTMAWRNALETLYHALGSLAKKTHANQRLLSAQRAVYGPSDAWASAASLAEKKAAPSLIVGREPN